MNETEAVLRRYLRAQLTDDLEALVSCWHPDVEAVHPLRPDLSWRGIDTYRRNWERIRAGGPRGRWSPVCTAVAGNRIYLETVTEHHDGTVVPCVSILEVEDGLIRRARVYTDRQVRDGVSLDQFGEQVSRAEQARSAPGQDT
jgi:ketosteroid isomerase-like protein